MRRRIIIVLMFVLLMLTSGTLLVVPCSAEDYSGNYVVTEVGGSRLSMVTPTGVRTVIYNFSNVIYLRGVAIDSAGNYIVAEGSDALSKITPNGALRTVIYNFSPGSYPFGIAIDSASNYIVTECGTEVLSKITPSGVRTVIYYFPPNSDPSGVAIDGAGNYIVAEFGSRIISKITPGGVRTVVFNFFNLIEPAGIAIDSEGNYVITSQSYLNPTLGFLIKAVPGGAATILVDYGSLLPGLKPVGVAIDDDGSYIVAEFSISYNHGYLSKISPTGVRTVIYDFQYGGEVHSVAIVPKATTGYSTSIWGWDYLSGWTAVPITMDGAPTGFNTPHTFTSLTGTHTFTVPSVNSAGHPFSDWDPGGSTSTTITVTGTGTWTARYRGGYSATIWSWCSAEGWTAVPITMDGSPTGFNTPHTFSGLTGSHTFTVPNTDANGHTFKDWDPGGSTSTSVIVNGAGTWTARYRDEYSASIWAWCAAEGWTARPITMDGIPTGFSTPHTFTGLSGSHTFTVPSTDASGHEFKDWDPSGSTSTSITVTGAGTWTARYQPGYSATIWAWCAAEEQGWISIPITMDGAPTGFNTPYTFSGLTGTHTFTVPSTDASGHPFKDWDPGGSTSTTITVNGAGTWTARYQAQAAYSATIYAYCVTENVAVGVPIAIDGSPSGFNTPHTFEGLTGTHAFTIPSKDGMEHHFRQWSTGSKSLTITVNTGGTYAAYYETPSFDIWANKASYVKGETMQVYVQVRNMGPATPARALIYLQLPNGYKYGPLLDMAVTLPANFDSGNYLWNTFQIPTSVPSGTYTWISELRVPTTNALIDSDTHQWTLT